MGHPPNDMIREPVFMVGSERSGTTLLRLMLDHHPGIAFHFEFEFAVERLADDGTFPPIEAYHKWLRSERGFRGSGERSIRPSIFPSSSTASWSRSEAGTESSW